MVEHCQPCRNSGVIEAPSCLTDADKVGRSTNGELVYVTRTWYTINTAATPRIPLCVIDWRELCCCSQAIHDIRCVHAVPGVIPTDARRSCTIDNTWY